MARCAALSDSSWWVLGHFLIVVAPLARFYMYPKLAVAPADQDSVSVLVGPDANVFDVSTLKNITTDLKTTAVTLGDVEAAEKAPDGVVVWVNTSSSKDEDGVVRSRDVDRVAFDEYTAEAVNCCDEYYSDVEGEQRAVEHKGLVFKFPFDTQKKDYDFWDSTLLKALPIRYAGVEEVEGVTVYKFIQDIEPTAYATMDAPASLLDLEDVEGNVEAEQVYSNARTLWVEPNTGVILKRTEEQYNTLRYEGEDRLVTTAVTTAYDDKTVKDNADEVRLPG